MTVEKIKSYLEKNAFGVCEYLGHKLGLKSNKIRIYFIYLSFFTAGSPILIYFILAFWLEHKNYFQHLKQMHVKPSVWDFSEED